MGLGWAKRRAALSLKTVVQSVDELPRLFILISNCPQSPNTAVCLLERDIMGYRHKTAYSGSHAEIRRTQASLAGFLFLCTILIPPLSPFTEKPGISLPSHS
jgi:hypothetical protein